MADSGAIIQGVGAVSPVGLGAAQTAVSVRAGVARFEESSVHDQRFEPFTMALVPEEYLEALIPELEAKTGLTSRQRRMLRLAGPALREALDGHEQTSEIPLFLGTPEALEERTDPAGEFFLEQLQQQAGVVFDTEASRMFPDGRAAGLLALDEALAYLDRADGDLALVGGVDTFLDLYLLATLDMEGRIAGARVMDGFIPGEGAAFLLLEAVAASRGADTQDRLRVLATGSADELGHRYSEDEPYKGEGLPTAIEKMISGMDEEPESVKTVFTGLNGENFGAKEWGTAYLRHSALYAEGFRIEHPVDCFGDIGAALGPMMITLADAGAQEGKLPGPFLVWCSSDREPRVVAYLANGDSSG